MSFTLLPWDTWGVYHCIDLFSIDPYWRWRWFDTHGLQIGNVRDKPWNNQSYTLWQLKMTNVGQQLEDHSSLTSPWLPAWEPGVQSRRSFERPTDWYHAAAGTKRGSTWQHQVMVGWCPKIASWRRSTLVAVTDASRSGALPCPKLMTHLAVACWVVAKTQISRAPACWQEIETPSQTLRLRISAGRIPSATYPPCSCMLSCRENADQSRPRLLARNWDTIANVAFKDKCGTNSKRHVPRKTKSNRHFFPRTHRHVVLACGAADVSLTRRPTCCV